MKTTATEVVIALQFSEPLPDLNALQIVALARGFEELPHYSEMPVAGPMPYSLGQLDGSEPIAGFVPSFNRVAIASRDRDRSLTFQGDRLTLSWVRTGDLSEEANYPGFDQLVAELMPLAQRFKALVADLLAVSLDFRVAELTYVNIIPTRTASDEPIRLSALFSFLARVPGSPGINGYFHAWNEKLGVADGVLRIQVNGPAVYAPGKPGASFTLAGAFLIADPANLDNELLAVRQRIGESYARVLVAEEDR